MIYVVKSDDYVKIGFSDNVKNRISYLQTSCPTKLDIVLIVAGDYGYEQELHKRFKEYKSNGEWFLFEQPIRDFVEKNLHLDRRYEFGFEYNIFQSNEQVKRLRNEHNLTLDMLGQYLGITAQSVKEIQDREKKGTISINVLKKVANVLGYKFEYRFVKKEY